MELIGYTGGKEKYEKPVRKNKKYCSSKWLYPPFTSLHSYTAIIAKYRPIRKKKAPCPAQIPACRVPIWENTWCQIGERPSIKVIRPLALELKGGPLFKTLQKFGWPSNIAIVAAQDAIWLKLHLPPKRFAFS